MKKNKVCEISWLKICRAEWLRHIELEDYDVYKDVILKWEGVLREKGESPLRSGMKISRAFNIYIKDERD